jgi:hypothetical protein
MGAYTALSAFTSSLHISGLTASRLGSFPFWTDTRTGAQEIHTGRLAVNPADILSTRKTS